jgi:transcription initiation factor TFIIB
VENPEKHTTTIIEKQEPPKKRGPGRPRKNKDTNEKTDKPKRGPGRPRKNKKPEKEPEKPKRKRGRPRKNKTTADETNTTTEKPKRKRGRPRKNKKPEKEPEKPKRKRGRPRKNKKPEEDTDKKEETKKTKKTKEKNKKPNPLLEIMDNFKDDKTDNDEEDNSNDDLNDFSISEPMDQSDVIIPEESDIELMTNSDIDVEEIIKIDTTESEDLEFEQTNINGLTEKEQMKEDVAEIEKQETICPECGSTKLINDHERGEVVCGNCGLVIDDNLVDMGPEWRAFDHEQRDKRTRVGAPITYTIHDKGLSTMIDWRNKDIYGRDIPARNRAQWYRLRKWQRKIRISGATERNLAFALSELDRDSSRLGLPRSVRESASVIYRNAVENKLIRGRSIEGVVAASLYAACRRCKVPRTLDEIAEVSRVSKKEVGRTYRFLTRELHIRLPPTSPIDYVPRFASELNLSGVVQSKAIEIINQAMDNGLTSGRGPTGVAAAALYIASVLLNERKTQRDVADIAGVTEVTIRNRYKELTEQLDMGVSL